MSSRLHQLSARGQSVWIDFLSREPLESGALARAISDDAVVEVTSNPTLFEQALSCGDAYDAQLASHAGAGARGCLPRPRDAGRRRRLRPAEAGLG